MSIRACSSTKRVARPGGVRPRSAARLEPGRSCESRRSPGEAPEFHGTVAASGDRGSTATRARPWSVSALETYLDCPFKFFAQHVLKLEEEPDDEEVMDPRRQGVFVHDVFEQFFDRWQTAGHRAITPGESRTPRARCSRTSWTARSSVCRTPKPASSARGCLDRRPRPASARRCSAWKPSGRLRSSSGCSSTGSTATFTMAASTDRAR